jgi:hypothetical protein
MKLPGIAFVLIDAVSTHAWVPPAGLAHTPPRGLNTWDSFRYWASEQNMKANAKVMAAKGLTEVGFEFQVVDEGWYRHSNNTKPHDGDCDPFGFALDQYGRYIPTVDRFPSAVDGNGLNPLCTELLTLGVKCGVHLISGVPIKAAHLQSPILNSSFTVDQIVQRGSDGSGHEKGVPAANYAINMSHPGSALYINSVVAQLKSWKVRFIKMDFGPTNEESQAYSAAIARTDAGMVLSVNGQCGGVCNMFRISSDVWDVWSDVAGQFKSIAANLGTANPGNATAGGTWPDADMLPLGRIGGVKNLLNESEASSYPPYNSSSSAAPCTAYNMSCGKNDDPHFRFEECCPRQSRLTHVEVRSLLSLWIIARSPLMLGGYLPETDDATLAMLNNSEAMRVNSHSADVRVVDNEQASTGGRVWCSVPVQAAVLPGSSVDGAASKARTASKARATSKARAASKDDSAAVTKPGRLLRTYSPTDRYVAFFNLNDTLPKRVIANFTSLFAGPGLSGSNHCNNHNSHNNSNTIHTCTCQVRDLWQQTELGPMTGSFAAVLLPHSSALVAVHSCVPADNRDQN